MRLPILQNNTIQLHSNTLGQRMLAFFYTFSAARNLDERDDGL